MHIISGLLYALAALSPVVSADTSSSDVPVQSLIDSANALLAQGDMNGALDQFDAAIKRDPTNYLTIFKRGATYLSLGKSDKASADFDAVLALKPDWEAALVQRAKLKARTGDWKAAQKDYKSAGKKDEIQAVKEAEKAAQAAEKAVEKGDYEVCEEQASKAIEVASGLVQLRLLRSKCRIQKGEVREAIGDLHHAAVLDPVATEPHIIISNLFFYSLADTDRAIQQISRCVHSDPENKACKKVYRRIKNHSKALAKAKAFREKGQFMSSTRLLVGTKEEPGIISEIKEEIEGLKEDGIITANTPMGLLGDLNEIVCDSYTNMDNLKRGAPFCDEALLYLPESLPALLSKAQRLIDADDFEEAVRILEKAKESHGNDNRIQEKTQKAQMLLRRSKQKDYYKVLGIARDATERDIKRAHRKLTKIYHPDKARDIPKEEAEKKMNAINEAYEVLKDPELRARFDNGDDPNDQTQQNPFAQGGFPFGGHGGGQQFFFQGGGGFPGGGRHNNFKFNF